MIEMKKAEFIAYIKRHKIAPKETVERYVDENPKEVYSYEDIDAVYQAHIEYVTTHKRHTVHEYGRGCMKWH